MLDERMGFFWETGLAAWVIGALLGYFLPLAEKGLELYPLTSVFALAIFSFVVFLACMLYFGKLSHIVLIGAGLVSGTCMQGNFFLGLFSAIPIMLAAYGGKKSAMHLNDDLHGDSNWFAHLNQIGLYLAISVIIAVALGLLQGFFPVFGRAELPLPLKQLFGVA
ncbi:MAG: hypothetical protein V1847_01785 [Candidatus Diapherotrites archaeon]